MKLTLDEIFEILPISKDEVELERTNDYGNIRDPNWESPIKQFSLGLQNAKETILSNMIAKKINTNTFGLDNFLDYIKWSQSQVFDFMFKILEKILSK